MMKKRGVSTTILLVVMMLLVPVLGACTKTTDPTTTGTVSPPPTTTPSSALLPTVAGVDAALLFSSKCASCHGVNREGGVAKALTDVSSYSTSFIATFVSVHFTGVGMAEPLRNSLANYLKTNSKPPATNAPVFSTDPAVVYASNCSLCHGSVRQGGLAGPNITPAQIVNFGTQAQLSAFISSHMTGKDLTPDRRDLLAGYLKTTP